MDGTAFYVAVGPNRGCIPRNSVGFLEELEIAFPGTQKYEKIFSPVRDCVAWNSFHGFYVPIKLINEMIDYCGGLAIDQFIRLLLHDGRKRYHFQCRDGELAIAVAFSAPQMEWPFTRLDVDIVNGSDDILDPFVAGREKHIDYMTQREVHQLILRHGGLA